jgi:DNA-binding NarL/FixJ family response regulator
MENGRILADSFIYVCSRNPIAICGISNLLGEKSLNWHVSRFFANPLPMVSESPHIALFDVSSIPEWPELIPKWTAAGYKIILLVAEGWGFGGARLRALQLGVAGIVDITTEFGGRLVDAIALVASGQLFAKQESVRKNHCGSQLANGRSPISRLSFREEQVIDLVILGFSNKRIGTVLGITERTAKFHVCNILHKLRARSRGELRTMDRAIVYKPETRSVSRMASPKALSG